MSEARSREIEEGLWTKYLNGKRIRHRNRLVKYYWPWIKTIVDARLQGHGVRRYRDEILSYAVERVIVSAIPRYDPVMGTRPMTFLTRHVLGAIQDGLRRCDYLKRTARGKLSKIDIERSKAAQVLGHSPNDSELAQFLDIPESEVIKAESYRHKPSQYHRPTQPGYDEETDDEDRDFAATIADTHRPPCLGAFIRLTDGLNKRHRIMLWLYYIDGYTQREIAGQFDVSESYVSQTLKQIREFLKKNRQAVEHFADIRQ